MFVTKKRYDYVINEWQKEINARISAEDRLDEKQDIIDGLVKSIFRLQKENKKLKEMLDNKESI